MGTDNVVSVQSVKTAECFPSEDSTVFEKILNLIFSNLLQTEERLLISLLLVMWLNTNLYCIILSYKRLNSYASPRNRLNAY